MLNEEGFVMNEIEDIRIGYSWTISSESVQIVEFTPTWYIKEWYLEDSGWIKAEERVKQNQRTDRQQRRVTQMDLRESAVVLIVCFFSLDLFLFS